MPPTIANSACRAAAQFNDSFHARMFNDEGEILGRTDWPASARKEWQWIPLAIGGGRKPTALELPAGMVNVQLRVREAGTKMDRLFITPNANERPKEQTAFLTREWQGATAGRAERGLFAGNCGAPGGRALPTAEHVCVNNWARGPRGPLYFFASGFFSFFTNLMETELMQ